MSTARFAGAPGRTILAAAVGCAPALIARAHATLGVAGAVPSAIARALQIRAVVAIVRWHADAGTSHALTATKTVVRAAPDAA